MRLENFPRCIPCAWILQISLKPKVYSENYFYLEWNFVYLYTIDKYLFIETKIAKYTRKITRFVKRHSFQSGRRRFKKKKMKFFNTSPAEFRRLSSAFSKISFKIPQNTTGAIKKTHIKPKMQSIAFQKHSRKNVATPHKTHRQLCNLRNDDR